MSAPRIESTDERELKALIREIPDFPKPGILFYDITTLLKDARGLHLVIDRISDHFRGRSID
jgi:adenine phosphoribosyltransferase